MEMSKDRVLEEYWKGGNHKSWEKAKWNSMKMRGIDGSYKASPAHFSIELRAAKATHRSKLKRSERKETKINEKEWKRATSLKILRTCMFPKNWRISMKDSHAHIHPRIYLFTKKTQQAFAVTFLENFGEIIEPLSGFTVYFCIEEFIYRIIKK